MYNFIYTNLEPGMSYYPEVAHYTFEMDSVFFRMTEYDGNIETYYTPLDTTQRVFNDIGYYNSKDNAYYHYIKDHIGNINAVVNSAADTLVQAAIYYASGVPMVESHDIPPTHYNAYGVQPNQNFGRDEQPYLYNGKEFIEAHGLNEYDSQARMYYATIMRTTTMDPLAEKYYHISPYAWCGNNLMNRIDSDGRNDYIVNKKGMIEEENINKERDAIFLVDDEGKHIENTSISFPYKTIEKYKRNGDFDLLVVRGDNNAEALFKFLSNNTNVEWGLFQMGLKGDKGYNSISTSHDDNTERCSAFLYNTQYRYGYTIRSHMHNHPNNTCYPSGIGENKGDINFATVITNTAREKGFVAPLFYIYIPYLGITIPYNKDSQMSDFIQYETVLLEELQVYPQK